MPLPPGVALTDLIQHYTAEEPTLRSEDGTRTSIEFGAACGWMTSWLTSQAADDQSAMAEAESGLRAVLHGQLRSNSLIGVDRAATN